MIIMLLILFVFTIPTAAQQEELPDIAWSIDIPTSEGDAVFSPDGKKIYINIFGTGIKSFILVLDAATGESLNLIHNVGIIGCFSPDGKYFYKSDLHKVSTDNYEIVKTADLEHIAEYRFKYRFPIYSPDGKYIYVTGWRNKGPYKDYMEIEGIILKINADNMKIDNYYQGLYIENLTVSSNHDVAFDSYYAFYEFNHISKKFGNIKIYNSSMLEKLELPTLFSYKLYFSSLKYSPDGRILAGISDRNFKFYDAENEYEEVYFESFNNGKSDFIKFANNSNYLIWYSLETESIKITDLDSDQEIYEYSQIRGYIYDVSSDDKKILIRNFNSRELTMLNFKQYPTDVQSDDGASAKLIHPNPASDYIVIPSLKSGLKQSTDRISIYSALGIVAAEVEASNGRVDISTLPPGIYYILIDGIPHKFMKH